MLTSFCCTGMGFRVLFCYFCVESEIMRETSLNLCVYVSCVVSTKKNSILTTVVLSHNLLSQADISIVIHGTEGENPFLF